MVGDAQRDVVIAQEGEDVGVVPAGLMELDGAATSPGKQGEEGRQAVEIAVQLRRQLEQDRAEVFAQGRHPTEDQLQGMSGRASSAP